MRGGEYNLKEALKDKRVELFEGKSDLLYQEQMEKATQGMDGVFHLASLCLAHCQDAPRLGVEINIMGNAKPPSGVCKKSCATCYVCIQLFNLWKRKIFSDG